MYPLIATTKNAIIIALYGLTSFLTKSYFLYPFKSLVSLLQIITKGIKDISGNKRIHD